MLVIGQEFESLKLLDSKQMKSRRCALLFFVDNEGTKWFFYTPPYSLRDSGLTAAGAKVLAKAMKENISLEELK